jgi:hypothetical protein
MENVRAPIFVRLGERRRRAGTFLRNVRIEGVEATGAIVSSSITGVPGLRPSDITLSHCRIRTVEEGGAAWAHRQIPEVPGDYPEARMMGRLPSYAFYLRHADRVRLHDVVCVTDKPDGRPAIAGEDVDDLVLEGLDLSSPVGGAPLIDLKNVRGAFLTGMRLAPGTARFVHVRGGDSRNIVLRGNALNPDEEAVSFSDGAAPGSARVD